MTILPQVSLKGGTFWMGSQLEVQGKVLFHQAKDGAEIRKKMKVKYCPCLLQLTLPTIISLACSIFEGILQWMLIVSLMSNIKTLLIKQVI